MPGTLYIVATPIGNLEDITLRALTTLKTVDLILGEDTRVTKKLLDHFGITTPTMSYHQHSTETRKREIRNLLVAGNNLALVTDAGTPGISDPGNELIGQLTMDYRQEPIDRRPLTIVPIPGPSAVIAALSICGFPTDKFLFLGFPPHKKKRKKFFEEVRDAKRTVAFYESNHRIKKTLGELSKILSPETKLCVCRELTKKFESVYRGTIAEIMAANIPEKGEFVVVVL